MPSDFLQTFWFLIQVCLGPALVFLVLYDVFQTVVVPRWTSRNWRIAPHLIALLWVVWLKQARRFRNPRSQDEWLGAFAPLCVLLVLLTWLIVLLLGYGSLIHALKDQIGPQPPTTWFGSFYIAGTSLLTIGYGDFVPTTSLTRLVFLSAAAAGLAMFALVISWLFTLYQSFSRREAQCLTLDGRAGSPSSGVTLLRTFSELDMTDEFHSMFATWELWTAEMLESHLAFPLLPFFRSSHDNQSWIGALGAVLDAATLLITTIECGPNKEKLSRGAAFMMYRIGCHAVADLSIYFELRPARNWEPTKTQQHPGVEIFEWRHARRKLEKAGYTLKPETESWLDFSERRAVYAWGLNSLAKMLAATPTEWIGDRSTLPYQEQHPHQSSDTPEELKVV